MNIIRVSTLKNTQEESQAICGAGATAASGCNIPGQSAGKETGHYQYTFTVFTPTYNRARTLPDVYESLKTQQFRDFEWLIVDDGSKDGTAELVEAWQKEACFPVRYFYQENKGKHVAFNLGVRHAMGELFLTLDSDDTCVPEALEKLISHWHRIPEAEKHKYSAVTGLCIDKMGEIVGTSFPADIIDSNSFEIDSKYGVTGEKWGFQRTAVLKEFPYPEFRDEKFVPESIVWNRISLKYKTRFVNEKLRIFEILPGGLSDSNVRLRVASPLGARAYYQEFINLPVSTKTRVRNFINYIRFSFHGQIPIRNIVLESGHRLLALVLLAPGYVFFKRDTRALRRILPGS